jgi:ferric enterobactin receptor
MSDKEIGAYSIVGIGSNYQLTKDLRLNADQQPL